LFESFWLDDAAVITSQYSTKQDFGDAGSFAHCPVETAFIMSTVPVSSVLDNHSKSVCLHKTVEVSTTTDHRPSDSVRPD